MWYTAAVSIGKIKPYRCVLVHSPARTGDLDVHSLSRSLAVEDNFIT